MIRRILERSFYAGSRVDQVQVNVVNIRNYARGRRVADPGVRNRLKLFSNDFAGNDPDTLESMESDFMNVGEAHKEFQREEEVHRKKISTLIVGRKHFSEKGINFLTWAEKEQIRMLHQKNPDEWTPDKLSSSFPTDPLTICRLLRNTWLPKDEKRVQKHDEAVKKNWEKFKAGDLLVEPTLEQHLKNFAQREIHVKEVTVNRMLGPQVPEPESSEFSSIITSCKKYSKNDEPEEFPKLPVELAFPDRHNPNKDSVILEGRSVTTQPMRLEDFQKFSPDIKTVSRIPIDAPASKVLRTVKDISSQPAVTTISNDDQKIFKSLEINERIKIPKNLWKNGKTYKVGDCFYDDDGEFLYRVPGLN